MLEKELVKDVRKYRMFSSNLYCKVEQIRSLSVERGRRGVDAQKYQGFPRSYIVGAGTFLTCFGSNVSEANQSSISLLAFLQYNRLYGPQMGWVHKLSR